MTTDNRPPKMKVMVNGFVGHVTEEEERSFVLCIDRNLASVPKTIEVVKYRSHKDCF